MSNEKIILECSKEIARIMDNYWPACDKAYFQGIYAEGGDLISVDVFFEKDNLLLKKNLVTYFDLIDCHQPRNIDDQKNLMKSLMTQFEQFAKAFDENFDPCFSVAEITLVKDDGSRHIRVRFNYDQNVLDDLEGGAHELHQKYFESVKNKLERKS
ncbi:MAG: hypothetical protein MJ246_01340 [Clostridia bacterium]|nr:hypothetical protein [Clostridia bacterium]